MDFINVYYFMVVIVSKRSDNSSLYTNWERKTGVQFQKQC